MSNLQTIVEDRDIDSLETYCLSRTHRQVIDDAEKLGVDQGELEELLQDIS